MTRPLLFTPLRLPGDLLHPFLSPVANQRDGTVRELVPST